MKLLVLIPLGSEIVAEIVGVETQLRLFTLVYKIEGPDKSVADALNCNAPISGVLVLVVPEKSKPIVGVVEVVADDFASDDVVGT